jgi:tetratricopeptide (TPR) repeat protein
VHDLRAFLTIDDLLEPIHLVGLDTDAVTELAVAEGTMPGAGTPPADLQERTGGNPFFCLQLVRHLGEAAGGTGPPVGVRDVVRQRVDRLGPAARQMLQLAAVAGMAFDVTLLDRLAPGPTDPEDLISILEAAVAARLLDEMPERPGHFRFVHALVQETLHAEVSAVRRAALHRRIAEVLAARAQSAAVVAHHMALGASADVIPDVVMWSQRAAAEQVGMLAFDDALDTLRRAVALVDTWSPADHGARAALHLTLAFLLGVLGDAAGQRDNATLAAADARAAGSLVMLVDAAIERGTWSESGVADPEAEQLLTAARSAATNTDPALLPTLLAVSAYQRANTGSGSIAMDPLAAEAEDLARAQGDPAQLFEVLHFRALLLQGGAALEEQRRIVAEMEDIVVRLGPELWQTPTTHVARMKLLLGVRDFQLGWWDTTGWLRFRAVVALQGGDMAAFVRDLEGATLSWGTRSRQMGATLAMWRGLRALLEGRFIEAEAHTNAILEWEGKDRNFINSWAGMQFQLARERGELEGLRPLLESALAETPGIIAFQMGLAVLLADAGELGAARSIVESLGPDLSTLQSALHPLTVMAELAEVVGRLGDQDRAEQLSVLLQPSHGQLIVVAWGTFVLGAADRYLAILADTTGDWRQADELFEAALSLEESVGGAPLATRTRLDWARCLIARKEADRQAAAGLLKRAAEDAAHLGMAGVLGEVSALQKTLER